MIPESIKNQLLTKAKNRFSEIFPVVNKLTLEECFTIEEITSKFKFYMLWYNDCQGSTHIEKIAM
jgi:hypothetical protein